MATCGTVTAAQRIEQRGVSLIPRDAEWQRAAAGRVSPRCRVVVGLATLSCCWAIMLCSLVDTLVGRFDTTRDPWDA